MIAFLPFRYFPVSFKDSFLVGIFGSSAYSATNLRPASHPPSAHLNLPAERQMLIHIVYVFKQADFLL